MLKGRIKSRRFSIAISCWGFISFGAFLAAEILEAGSFSVFLQRFTQPSLLLLHSLLFLSVPGFIVVGYFYQKLANSRERPEQMVDEMVRVSRGSEGVRMAEDTFREIFESANDVLIYLDRSGRILDVNQKTVEVFGGSRDELLGKHFTRVGIFSLKDIPTLMRNFANILEGKKVSIDLTFKNKNGQEKSLECSASLLKRDGKTSSIMVVARDITERKEAEKTLQESEEKFRAIFEGATDGILAVDPKTQRLIFANPRICEITGYSSEQLLSLDVGDIHPKKDLPYVTDQITKQTQGKLTLSKDIPVLRKDERVVYCDVNSKPIKIGSQEYLVGFFRDVTERRKAEGALQDAMEKWVSLTENTDDVVMIVDGEGVIQYINRTIPPYTPQETVGKTVCDYVPRKQHEVLRTSLRKVFETGEPDGYEASSTIPKIGTMWFSTKAVPIQHDGKVSGVILISADITERKNMEEQLKEYSECLEEKVEERTNQLKKSQERLLKAEKMAAIGEVAAMVGHDLRNPLQAITNMLYLSEKKTKPITITEKEILEKHGFLELGSELKAQVGYMEKIVCDLQDYAKPLKPQLAEIDLHQLISKTLSSLTVPENVRVSIMIKEGFPKLILDPMLMKRVFSNLITNALQAMLDGGQLTIRASKKGETALIGIEDTGIGIPDENLSKLFTPFFTAKAKGQGLGLAVCKRMVEAHDGNITIESKVGKGSTFTVRIPLRREVSKK